MRQFCTQVFPGRFTGFTLNVEGSRIGELLKVDTEDLRKIPPSEIIVTSLKSKEVDILKRINEIGFPCRTGEILQEAQLSSTALYEAEGDLMRESQQHSAERMEEARDPDCENTNIGSCCSENKTVSSEGRFPILLHYIDVQRQKTTPALTDFTKQPPIIIGILMERSHRTNPGSE